MNDTKKSQITFFILFSLIIFFLILGIFFLRNMMINASIKDNFDDSLSAQKDSSLEYSFKSCIDGEVQKVINKAALQGGFLFKEDFGAYERSQVESYSNVSYVLSSEVNFLYEIPSNFKKTSSSLGLMKKDSFGNPIGIFNKKKTIPYFGSVLLPKLCLRDGPNDPRLNYSKYSCPSFLYNTGNSDKKKVLQDQLSTIFQQKVMQCFSQIKDKSLYLQDKGDFEVIFTDDSVVLESDWHLLLDDGALHKKFNINYEFPYRIKKLFSFAYDILNKDTLDINFNISEDYIKSSYYDDFFRVERIENYTDSDDLIIIRDMKSDADFSRDLFLIYDILSNDAQNYLTFLGLIENRRPYLESIDNISYDVQDVNDATFEQFELEVYDSDDDPFFDIETHYDYSLESITYEKEDGSLSEPIENSIEEELTPDKFSSTLFDKNTLIFNTELNCSKHCYYKGGNQDSLSYATTIYTYKIRVWDEEGLEDYQSFSLRLEP